MNEFKITRYFTLFVDSIYQGYQEIHKKTILTTKKRKRKNYKNKKKHAIEKFTSKELLLNMFLPQ